MRQKVATIFLKCSGIFVMVFLMGQNVRNRNYVKKCLDMFALYICKFYVANHVP